MSCSLDSGSHACMRSSSTKHPRRSAASGRMCTSSLMKDSWPSLLVSIRPKMSLCCGSMISTTWNAYDLEPIVYTWSVASCSSCCRKACRPSRRPSRYRGLAPFSVFCITKLCSCRAEASRGWCNDSSCSLALTSV